MIVLLLTACGALPPAELGACAHVPAGYQAEINEPGGGTRPAFWCESYWTCEDGDWFEGRTYLTNENAPLIELGPGTAASDDTDFYALWCDRCEWAGDHALILVHGSWYDLASHCDWTWSQDGLR